jgi:NADH-quinone oxidoreductase subunit E
VATERLRALSTVEELIEACPAERASLIPLLQDIQRLENWLSREHLQAVSERLRLPLAEVFRVATFYDAFSLTPRGLYHIRVCAGTACHLRGSGQVRDAIQRELGLPDCGVTDDMMFSLETVNCLGACALAPVMVVNEKYHPKVTPASCLKIIDKCRKQGETPRRTP